MNDTSGNGFGSRPLLAFNDPWHDSSFFFADAGRVVHVESERFTRRKYEYINPIVIFCEQFPELVEAFPAIGIQINGELQKYLTRLAQIKHGADGATAADLPPMPFADRLLETGSAEERARAESPAVRAFVRHLMRDDVQLYFFGHYGCHAANAYYSSGFDEALIVSLDGGGMDYGLPPGGPNHFTSQQVAADAPGTGRRHLYGAVHTARGNDLRLVRQFAEQSIGQMWLRALDLMGLKDGEEGTAMAMAGLGDPARFRAAFASPAPVYPFDPVLPPAQRAELDAWMAGLRAQLATPQDAYDLAAAMQECTERRVRGILADAITPEVRNLCVAGGVFLNCQVTGKILEWFPSLRSVYTPPAPYDGGLSIGAGQLMHHDVFGLQARLGDGMAPFAMGRQYGRDEVLSAIRETGMRSQDWDDDALARSLLDGEIVAVFHGSSESGRRALGNRSILAHPGFEGMKDRINATIKHRQWFRPFAPMVLAEHATAWFDCDERFESPYMSFAVPVRQEVGDRIRAIIHIDGTARVQTVHRELTPRLHALVSTWHAASGIPVLLNTSFNDREPIVETPLDALRTFARTPIDKVYFPDLGLVVTRPDAALD